MNLVSRFSSLICVSAFTLAGQIYTVNIDSSGFRKVADIPVPAKSLRSIAYSPDGKKIAYGALSGDNRMQVFVMNSDGSNVKQITSNDDPDQAFPIFTSDGTKLLISERDPSQTTTNLFFINLDGTGKHLILKNGATGQFSTDGSKIVFMRFLDFQTQGIFICNADGTQEKRVMTGASPSFGTRPTFNPKDSSEILFNGFILPDKQTIRKIRIDGSGERSLVDVSDRIALLYSGTHYSPDGESIVYSLNSLADRKFDIYRIHTDGSQNQKLTNQADLNFIEAQFVGTDNSKIFFLGSRKP
jgi:Tol biopolymer transport system component